MIIFIRGIPGSGKTVIADKLAEKIGWKVIHIDDFKKEFSDKNPKAFFIEEVVPYSYKKTLEILENYKNENIIVEEIFRNRDFVQQISDFCDKNNITNRWFNIVRDIKKVLETNEMRNRKVKNMAKTLESMRQQIDDVKIEKEITINNENIDESVQKIFNNLD
jgi:adenylate kinase family enzyme